MRFNPIHDAFIRTDATLHRAQTGQLDNAYSAWKTGIVAMEQLLEQYCQTPNFEGCDLDVEAIHGISAIAPIQGLIFSGPTPTLYQPTVLTHFQTCLWIPQLWTRHQPQLLPCSQNFQASSVDLEFIVPLQESDPLLLEQFCLVLTPDFCWCATLSHPPDAIDPFFAISFDPQTIHAILHPLLERVQEQRPGLCSKLKQWIRQYPPVTPDYRWPMYYSRLVLEQTTRCDPPSVLVDVDEFDLEAPDPVVSSPEQSNATLTSSPAKKKGGQDIELLKAIAHEIRTPLATIQTLTRLLIRRQDLPADVIRRLEAIQQECTNQIDRFSLIFRAIELTTTPLASLNHSLTAMSLRQLFTQRMGRWQSILERRSLEFKVTLPDDLPAIAIRDPNMLDQVLTGLIEQLSHTLPLGSQISMQITLAGEQLKLQLRSSVPDEGEAIAPSNRSMLKAVGQLLMLQPETGNLSLSLPATKQIFNFLGGKLTVRQSSPRGEVLTMFLPLDPLTASFL